MACELAMQFDLGPRIVARHGAAAVTAGLGAAAGALIRAHRGAVALALASERTARLVARLAARRGLPILFLKGSALQLVAPGPAGWRPFLDLDVLLTRRDADQLRAALLAAGWESDEEAGNPQHLPPLTAPGSTPLDIHYRLRGVRVGAARWATAEELLTAGLCRPAGLAAGSWVPREPLLAAHLAVHALEQHGYRPATYPLLRAVADLADLTAATEGGDLAAEAGAFVGESLGAGELRAMCTLGRVLAEGRAPAADGASETAAEALLRHIVAGVLDPVYRRSLALDHAAGRLREALRDGDLMRYITHKLRGSAGRLEASSSKPTTGPGSVGRRLLHPIRILARFATAAWARVRRAFAR